MVQFVIAGKPDCRNMVQVMNIVYYLKDTLPNFEYNKIEMTDEEWGRYLMRTNKQFNWHHNESPLIYKEIYHYGSAKPCYIGGMSEFWEYCYDYYGLECKFSPSEVDTLLGDNMKHFTKGQFEKLHDEQNIYTIMIYGATNTITSILLSDIMMIEGLNAKTKVRFILYDEKLDTDDGHYFKDFAEEFKDMFGSKAIYCDNLTEGIKDADMLIFVDDTSEVAANQDIFQTYICQIYFLVEEINNRGRRSLRIIFANSGISCYVATILARKTIIPFSQIVVISSDLGLGYLGEVSRRLNIDVKKLGAPPVWGFIGFNEFVDVGSCLMKCNIHKPYKRATRATPNSTLIHGTTYSELRFINYLTDDIKDLRDTVHERRDIVKEKLNRAPILAKIKAVVNLIAIWCNCTTFQEPIVCLGVMTDGSFNLPERIVFSQPAIQYRNGWIPYSEYPVPSHVLRIVRQMGDEADEHFTNTYLGMRGSSVYAHPRVTRYRSIHTQLSEASTFLRRSQLAFL